MTTEKDIEHLDDALAAEYVLGVLPHAERLSFSARLASEADLRIKVQFWEEQLVSMTDSVEPVTPSAQVLSRIEGEIFAASDRISPANAPSWWLSLGFWRGLSMLSLATLVVLAALYSGILTGPRGTDTEAVPLYVAELSGDSDVQLVTVYDASSGVLKMNRVKGAPAAGRSFELWLIEGGNNPVSLGLVPTTVRGTVTVPENLRDKFADAVLAISDEPEGGSPTGQATGAVLAAGKLAAI